MKSESLSVYEFGRQLVETRDIDPVYVVLWEAKLDRDTLGKFLWAYWCFYHCGTSAWIVDSDDYWEALVAAASTKEHPRAAERRHFRGDKAIKAAVELRSHALTCSELLERLYTLPGKRPPTLADIVLKVREHRGFGSWIAFKVADMVERLNLSPVIFRPTDVFAMYETPRKGAERMAERHGPAKGNPYVWAYNSLIRELFKLKAPPRYERTLNIQEIETILCKWNSHLNGHYPMGKDARELEHGLKRYAHCPTAERLLNAGEKARLW